jgi:hypothetical protein
VRTTTSGEEMQLWPVRQRRRIQSAPDQMSVPFHSPPGCGSGLSGE